MFLYSIFFEEMEIIKKEYDFYFYAIVLCKQ